jgi:hypothetical protein
VKYLHLILPMLFNIGLLVFIPVFVGYFFLANRFSSGLKIRHNSAWLDLGAPIILGRGSDKSKFLVYLVKRKYLSLNDESLTRLGDLVRAVLLISVVSMGALLIDGFTMFFLFTSGG